MLVWEHSQDQINPVIQIRIFLANEILAISGMDNIVKFVASFVIAIS